MVVKNYSAICDCGTERTHRPQHEQIMNKFDERYQSPVSEAGPVQKTPLTKEEWRYAGKMFFLLSFGAALLRGFWPVWQWQRRDTQLALRTPTEAFYAELHAVATLRPIGAVVTLFGVCMALFFVVRRRMKAGLSTPNHGLFWPMFATVPLGAPLAASVMVAGGTGGIWVAHGPMSILWIAVALETVVIRSALVGFSIGTITAVVYALFGTVLARVAAWAYNWPILVGIAIWFVTEWSMELVAYPVKFVLSQFGWELHF